MSGVALPSRPRLAEHAMVRRHFIDGEEVIVVHDARSGDLVRMPPRAWSLIEAADGTRDIGGLLLAASQRGELRRASEVTAVLTDLQAAGLLTDGIDPFAFAAVEAAAEAVDARAALDVLPFTLVCDGSGACCATYSTVRFSEEEAARARSLLPHVEEGRGKVFLPLTGSGAQPSCAVTMIDGRCTYLAGDGACELHRRHGAAAKPSGCAIYPATFAFDGEAVRVSLGVECACIAKSLGKKDGTPLVAEAAAVRGDLPAGAQVVVLPEAIELREGVTAPRAEVVRWSRAVLRAWAGASGDAESHADAVAVLWALERKWPYRSDWGARGAAETRTDLAYIALASVPDREAVQRRWGVTIVDADLPQALDRFAENIDAPVAEPVRLRARHHDGEPDAAEVETAARFEPVATRDPRRRLDPIAEVAQAFDVAPHRPLGHPEPVREFGPRPVPMGLQQVQQGEGSGGGTGHASRLPHNADRTCPH